METIGTGTRAKQTAIPCCIPGMSVKRWLCLAALVLLSVALCVVVFAGEPRKQSGGCDLQTGLAATLNLSQTQCENMRQLTDRLRNHTATTRGKILEKRLQLKKLSEDPKTDPYAINRTETELNVLELEFSRRAHKIEAGQRRL